MAIKDGIHKIVFCCVISDDVITVVALFRITVDAMGSICYHML